MSESDKKRDNKRKAPGTPPPVPTPGSYLADLFNFPEEEEDCGLSIKICLPSVQDKEHFHRTALTLIEKLSEHMATNLSCHVPIRKNRRHLTRVLSDFGFVTELDPGALMQYILDVPCADACVCDTAPEENQPLDRCDAPEHDRRASERAQKLDDFFLDPDRFSDLGPKLPFGPPGEGVKYFLGGAPDHPMNNLSPEEREEWFQLLKQAFEKPARDAQLAHARKKAGES